MIAWKYRILMQIWLSSDIQFSEKQMPFLTVKTHVPKYNTTKRKKKSGYIKVNLQTLRKQLLQNLHYLEDTVKSFHHIRGEKIWVFFSPPS